MTKDTTITESTIEAYTLLPPEVDFLVRRRKGNRLAQALLLKYFQENSRFPEKLENIPPEAINWVAEQLAESPALINQFDWYGRTGMRFRMLIRDWLGFQPTTVKNQADLRNWLVENVLPKEHRLLHLEKIAYQHLKEQKLEPSTEGRMRRLTLSAIHQYEQRFFAETSAKISVDTQAKLKQLVHKKQEIIIENVSADQDHDDPANYPIHELRSDAGEAKVKTMRAVAGRLKYLQAIGLPADLFVDIPQRFLEEYAQKAMIESLSHLQRHHDEQTITLLAAFSWVRERQLTDQLIELLIQLLNTIRLRAKQKVEKELLADFIKVGGKQQLLFRMASAIWENPDGIIRDVLFPLIGEDRLEQLVKESKQTGNYYQSVQTRISGSYTHHYRQILPELLEVLEFRSNNDCYKPLIDALSLISAYLEESDPYYPVEEEVPLDDVIQKQWHSWIYQQDKNGNQRIRRVRYELCVLQTLREKLRCKEIWLTAGNRFRNPDEDVPSDFSIKRDEYYEALNLPLDADIFIKKLQTQMSSALQQFNDTLPDNHDVDILEKDKGWIRLTPLDKQVEPTHLRALKNHIRQQWWMTSLLDIIKEVDDRVNFTAHFHSLTGIEKLDQAELRKRLLLCLFGLGTNTGLTSVSMGDHGFSYANLQYTRRRYISRSSLRQAIQSTINATLEIKDPKIWGSEDTWCASDSKQFAAWNQNLRTQWHKRYRRAGVMVYWHVAKNSLCIYSQLKAPSSSEVASMIEGVLRHCTEQQVDKTYVDTHGQSEVGFAFCKLLGFQLMPRLKNLHKQKLSLPFPEDINSLTMLD